MLNYYFVRLFNYWIYISRKNKSRYFPSNLWFCLESTHNLLVLYSKSSELVKHDQQYVKNKFVKNKVVGREVHFNLDNVNKYTVFFLDVTPNAEDTVWFGEGGGVVSKKFIVKTQRNSTQLNSKATSVGVRHSSHVFHPTPPHPTTTHKLFNHF